jgi:probable rRNA maturation factor
MVVNRQRSVAVAVGPLEDFAGQARRALRFPEDGVTVCLISDAAIARLNRRYRGKTGPTDVLSFPANADDGSSRRAASRGRGRSARGAYAGDIAISPAAARRNARRCSRSLPEELRILILHGMLHLAGYDHESDHGEMERLERRMRRRLGLR